MQGSTLVIGLTGSIGMGKTTVTRQLEQLGAKTCNADTIVHTLLEKGGQAVAPVGEAFPETLKNGAIDRAALGAIVFNDAQKRRILEGIIHPMVVAAEEEFVRLAAQAGAKLVVLDIPLLFETGADKRFDHVIVVTAPYWIQRYRVLKRPGMTEEKFRRILGSQMPDADKRRLADKVIYTGLGKAYSLWQLKKYIRQIT
jgi:dephospho-CoA kinase